MKINWTEGQQVVAIVVLAGLLIFGLWYFALLPLNRQRQQLQSDNEAIAQQLKQRNYFLGEEILGKQKTEEDRRYAALATQWTQTLAQISLRLWPDEEVSGPVGHIDYKVELYQMRERLRGKSAVVGTLAIDDSVDSNEDARKLLYQLRAVEELADLTLSLKIGRLESVEPQPPVRHTLGENRPAFMEEFPLAVRFSGTSSNLFDLIQATLDPRHAFVVRDLRVQKASPRDAGRLEITALMSALVFAPFTNDYQVAVEAKPSRPHVSMGY